MKIKILLMLATICVVNMDLAGNCNKLITIKYVNFSLMTDSRVDCEIFEECFGYEYDSLTVSDSTMINILCDFVSKFKKDTINFYMPDVRAKVIISTSNKNSDIICVSNLGLSKNGIPMIMDTTFLSYLKSIISKKTKRPGANRVDGPTSS